MIDAFDWLRPGWLLALPAGLALLWAWWRSRAGTGLWRGLVDPALLPHLVGRRPAPDAAPDTRGLPLSGARSALGLAAVALLLVCVALAGPSWHTQPAPLYRDLSARVIVLDLSPSMDAIDLTPSRLERARAAVAGLLRDAGDAQLGLVVFGGDAFTVAPLMNDAAALVHLLASLGTSTVPRAGSRPDLGLDMARRLLERSGVVAGDVILVGDSAGDARTLEAAQALRSAGFPLSLLAVGTPQGGPVRLAGGTLAKTANNDLLVAQPDLDGLERVARAGGGRYLALTAADAEGAAAQFTRGAQAWAVSPAAPARESSLRRDDGGWFVLFALPFAALLFRRGWLAGFAAVAIALPAPQAEAQAPAPEIPAQTTRYGWQDLWRRADQQAAALVAAGRFGDRAQHAQLDAVLAKLEPGSAWQAMLLYRGGRFAEAAARFAEQDSADAHYNRGNALALEGRLEAAMAAYDAALERHPSMRDALFNRALVREALARQRARQQGESQTGDAQRSGAAQPSAGRPGAAAHGNERKPATMTAAPQRGTQPSDARASGRSETRADEAQSPAAPGHAAKRPVEGLDGAELRRLEGLLARVPDDPGKLLANRFAWQLRMRGTLQPDTGARW